MFAGIFPNPAESGEEMLRFCQASGLVFPCYRDPSRNAARTLGATVTPEAFLLDSGGKVVYKGGIAGLEKALDDVDGQAAGRALASTGRRGLPSISPARRWRSRIHTAASATPPN